MTMEWKDGALQLDGLQIVVTNKHIDWKGVWVMHVRELGWHCAPINVDHAATEQSARSMALFQVHRHLFKLDTQVKHAWNLSIES